MVLDHDSELAVETAVSLVNSDDRRSGSDSLNSSDDVLAFIEEHDISGFRAGTDAEVRAVRRVRRHLREIFDMSATGDDVGAVAAVNQLIAGTGAVPQLVEHDGSPLHLHFTPGDAPLDRRIGADIGVALAIVIRDGGLERLRVCDAPGCGRVFVDLSRNRSRRYCDTLCGNRQNVAAYRRRRAHPA
jgi:predicted RNA-binding Zn ribbon-like protein